MTPKQREQMLDFCQLASPGLDNQNTTRSLGGMKGTPISGALYQYSPSNGECRGNGVLGQGVAIMGCCAGQTSGLEGRPCRESASAGRTDEPAVLDQRTKRRFGALREAIPGGLDLSRGRATGAMAFCALSARPETRNTCTGRGSSATGSFATP